MAADVTAAENCRRRHGSRRQKADGHAAHSQSQSRQAALSAGDRHRLCAVRQHHPPSDTYERFENVIVALDVVRSRTRLRERHDPDDQGQRISRRTRRPAAAPIHDGDARSLRASGPRHDRDRKRRLFKALNVPTLSPQDDRVMICGNPEMLVELRDMLIKRGFTKAIAANRQFRDRKGLRREVTGLIDARAWCARHAA